MKAMLLLALVAGGCAARPLVYTPLQQARLQQIEARRQAIIAEPGYRLCRDIVTTGQSGGMPATAEQGERCRVLDAQAQALLADLNMDRVTVETDAQVAHLEEQHAAVQAGLSAAQAISASQPQQVHLNCVQTGPTTSVCNGN